MSIDVGINFRATSGYVTDSAGQTYCIGDNYPTTRGGLTFGWNTSVGGNIRNRDNSSPFIPEFVGINFSATVGQSFQADLPSTGATDIHAIFGDVGGNNFTAWDLYDSTTLLTSITEAQPGSTQCRDAHSSIFATLAAWKSGEVKFTYTAASTTFKLKVRTSTGNNVVAHIRIVQATTGITGDASNTLAALTLSSAGTLPIQAAASDTLAAITLASAGTLPLQAAAAITLAAVTLTSNATDADHGNASITLADATLASTGVLQIQAASSVTLADVTLVSSSGNTHNADAAITLDSLTLSSTATIPIRATDAGTLADLTISAAASLHIQASISATFGSITLAAAGTLAIVANANITLAALTVTINTGHLIPSIKLTGGNPAITLTGTLGTISLTGDMQLRIG